MVRKRGLPRWLARFLYNLRRQHKSEKVAILEACVIGLAAGLSAAALNLGVNWLGTWRVHESHLYIWALPMIGLVGGLIAGLLVERVAPETSGSGIPQVKAVLARVKISLDLRTAVIKLIGGIVSIGSGLPLGREGPTVQVGAALAARIGRWIITSAEHRRQLIAAGAGAGLAAAFHAPIAGVIFVIEELIRNVAGLTVSTAILACFVAATTSRLLGGHSLNLDLKRAAPDAAFFLHDIFFCLLVGVLAGVLGALLNKGILVSLNFNFKIMRLALPWRVGLAGLICGLLVSCLPFSFRDNAGLRELLVTGEATGGMAAVALGLQFVLTIVAYGSGAPGGLFAPSLTLGAALGYLIGLMELHLLGVGIPTAYACVGMGAFFSAVARVPITAIVIVFEMTENFNLVLPLMVACGVASLVANRISAGGIYDLLLEWMGIHLRKETDMSERFRRLTVAEFMQRDVPSLASSMTTEQAAEYFHIFRDRGFTVVDSGKLVGVVTQSDLSAVAQRTVPGDICLGEIMTPQPVTVAPTDSLKDVLAILDVQNLSCLPVIENRKLVGVITRADVIAAMAAGAREATAVGDKTLELDSPDQPDQPGKPDKPE